MKQRLAGQKWFRFTSSIVIAAALSGAGRAYADDTTFTPDEAEGKTPPPPPPDTSKPPDTGDISAPPDTGEPEAPVAAPKKTFKLAGYDRASWKDIIVIPQKSFLKNGRFELEPYTGVTINDNLIRHYAFGAEINYFLTDALGVGVEGQYFQPQPLDRYHLTPQQHWRVPTANKYLWEAALNFSYIPMYGKFAVFNKGVVHWEGWVAAGVGVGQSEVLPRDPANKAFTNFLIEPNVGGGLRFFVFDWLSLHFGIRDYIFLDKFENANRPGGGMQTASQAKDRAESQLINNVLVTAGVSFWFPLGFHYHTFR